MKIEDVVFDTEAYYFIEELDCKTCKCKRDFYMNEETAHCVCCHSEVEATKSDFESVANRSPREGFKRFSGLIGGSDLEKSHNKHFNISAES